MRRIKSVGLTVASMLALAVSVGAASASAFTVWRLDGANVTSSVATTFTFTLDLRRNGAFGNATLHCTGTGAGSVRPAGSGTVDSITVTGCTTISGVCGSPRAAPANLAWATQLSGSRDNITPGPSGRSPGWTLTCSGVSVTCTAATSTAITDSPPNVVATFDASSATSLCTDGTSSTVTGTVTNSVAGHTLSAA
jgi:hypothetical protein